MLARYGEYIPVVLVDGEQHDFWQVSPERLRAALRADAVGARALPLTLCARSQAP